MIVARYECINYRFLGGRLIGTLVKAWIQPEVRYSPVTLWQIYVASDWSIVGCPSLVDKYIIIYQCKKYSDPVNRVEMYSDPSYWSPLSAIGPGDLFNITKDRLSAILVVDCKMHVLMSALNNFLHSHKSVWYV